MINTADQFGVVHGRSLLLLDHHIFFINESLAVRLLGYGHDRVDDNAVKLALHLLDRLPGDGGVGDLYQDLPVCRVDLEREAVRRSPAPSAIPVR